LDNVISSGYAKEIYFHTVSFNISLCDTAIPVNIEVKMTQTDIPFEVFTALTDSNGFAIIDSVDPGEYRITGYKSAYDSTIIESMFIQGDSVVFMELQQRKYRVYDLYVDSLSLDATWSEPRITVLYEDFEGDEFPPQDWQCHNYISGCDSTYNCNWMWLVTPSLDLRLSDGFQMTFDVLFTGGFQVWAYVMYSYDGGQYFYVLYQISPSSSWQNIELDLSGYSGPDAYHSIKFAFHFDSPDWPPFLCIDNVSIHVPEPPAIYNDFAVHLDSVLIGNATDTTWNFATLNYGQTYTAGVAVGYECGYSKIDTFQFTCKYLSPPRNLTAEYISDHILLEWLPPGDDSLITVSSREIPDSLYGYNIYKNDSLIGYIDHDTNGIIQRYFDYDLQAGYEYCYEVTAIYEVSSDSSESTFSNEACTMTVGLFEQEFFTFNIYPNPVENILNINSFADKTELIISIYDITGRVVERVVVPKGQDLTKINMSNFNSGIYIVVAIGEDKIIGRRKFVVMK
jgi:hypothetical protein